MRNRLTDAFVALVLGSAVTLPLAAHPSTNARLSTALKATLSLPKGRDALSNVEGQRGGALAARVDRIAGHPNLNGIWQAINTANWNLEGHSASATAFSQLGALFAVPAGRSVIVDNNGTIPYTPEGCVEGALCARGRQAASPAPGAAPGLIGAASVNPGPR